MQHNFLPVYWSHRSQRRGLRHKIILLFHPGWLIVWQPLSSARNVTCLWSWRVTLKMITDDIIFIVKGRRTHPAGMRTGRPWGRGWRCGEIMNGGRPLLDRWIQTQLVRKIVRESLGGCGHCEVCTFWPLVMHWIMAFFPLAQTDDEYHHHIKATVVG